MLNKVTRKEDIMIDDDDNESGNTNEEGHMPGKAMPSDPN